MIRDQMGDQEIGGSLEQCSSQGTTVYVRRPWIRDDEAGWSDAAQWIKEQHERLRTNPGWSTRRRRQGHGGGRLRDGGIYRTDLNGNLMGLAAAAQYRATAGQHGGGGYLARSSEAALSAACRSRFRAMLRMFSMSRLPSWQAYSNMSSSVLSIGNSALQALVHDVGSSTVNS